MDNDRLTPFLFEGEIVVRIIDRDGQPWFVAADVCRALGLLNAADTVKALDDDEKGIDSIYTPGGRQEVIVISESGLFVLIFKSRKPEAVRFRKWVTSEVLPSLRRVGSYTTTTAEPIARAKKPYEEWSLEEIRVALAQVRSAGDAINQATAVWMWEHVGLPMPPRVLLPAWWQKDLFSSQAS
jgi:prophage antirepressor-like protein